MRVPDSRWVIASGMNVGAPAHLYLIDSRRKRATIAYSPDARRAPLHGTECSGPPDPLRMSLDGLALRPGARGMHTLYAANHGDRMAIEIFSIDARGARPRLRWRDCALLPQKTLPNAVATLPGGSFLVISFYDPSDPQAWARMAQGQMTGRILKWEPGRGFSAVPNSATSGGNGLETSADGSQVYASSWSARRLVVLSLRDGNTPGDRPRLHAGQHSPAGRWIAAGCRTAHHRRCHPCLRPTVSAALDARARRSASRHRSGIAQWTRNAGNQLCLWRDCHRGYRVCHGTR